MLVDTSGPAHAINLNTVSGTTTIRLDDDLAANYVVRSGTGLSNYAGSTGELSGSFVDVRANSVSGDVTVLRRGSSGVRAGDLEAEEEW